MRLGVALWILSRLVPEREREAFVGDLIEEYSLRAREVSSSAALRWGLRQVGVSLPSLVWFRLTRSAWIATCGVAIVAYLAVAIVELGVNRAISNSSAYNPLGMLITFPMVVLIGYFAAGWRRGAAIVLGAMMLVTVTVMTLSAAESMPVWYRVAYFFVGPAAALSGTALHRIVPR